MAERFTVETTPLSGLVLVQRRRLGDARGFLSRLFCHAELQEAGFSRPVAQINQTLTHRRGSLRGMHFQHSPHAEDKYVSVLKGEVFDVAVDLRAGSPTFLQWHGAVLSAENQRSFFIPAGFAHGFQTLADDCELLYLHTADYAAGAEGAVSAFDPAIGIEWPIEVTDLSARDANHPRLPADYAGIAL